jgi:uncharacterized membrane protein (DUF106 family)
MKSTVLFGFLAGVIMGLISLGILFSGSTILYTKQSIAWLFSLGLPMIFMIIGGIRERKLKGGFMTYGEALKTCYVILLVAIVTSTVFGLIYHNVIDRDYFSRHKETMMQGAEETMRSMGKMLGQSETEILQLLDDTAEQREKQFMDQERAFRDPLMILQSLLIFAIFGIILALIAALLVRKNPKPETT